MSQRSIALARLGANLGRFPGSVFRLTELSALLVEGFVSAEVDGSDFVATIGETTLRNAGVGEGNTL